MERYAAFSHVNRAARQCWHSFAKLLRTVTCLSYKNVFFWGLDPDPDPRIHVSNQWIRIQILMRDPANVVIDCQDAGEGN